MKPERITWERKKAKVRDAILRAAMELSESQGFDRTTVDEIAATAEVSTRTFFRYFPNKEAVMFPYHAAYVARFRSLLREYSTAGPPLEVVLIALWKMAEQYMAAREEHKRIQSIIASSPALIARTVAYDLEWEAAIAEAWKNGTARGAAARRQARLAASVIMGAVHAVMAEWYEGGCRADLRKLGESAVKLLEHGIGNGADGKSGRRRTWS